MYVKGRNILTHQNFDLEVFLILRNMGEVSI